MGGLSSEERQAGPGGSPRSELEPPRKSPTSIESWSRKYNPSMKEVRRCIHRTAQRCPSSGAPCEFAKNASGPRAS